MTVGWDCRACGRTERAESFDALDIPEDGRCDECVEQGREVPEPPANKCRGCCATVSPAELRSGEYDGACERCSAELRKRREAYERDREAEKRAEDAPDSGRDVGPSLYDRMVSAGFLR